MLWWATVLGLVLQDMAARIGLVTGQDLAQLVREEYPPWVRRVVYVMMEIAVISADIQMVVGCGVALHLLTGMTVWAGCLVTGIDTFTFFAIQYLGVRYQELFVGMLISTMAVSFFINWGISHQDGGKLLRGWFVPSLKPYMLTQCVGAIGSVIMPHNLYLNSGLVLTRKFDRKSARQVYNAIWYSRIDAALALLVSFVINLAVVATNAANFYSEECATVVGGPYACLGPRALVSGYAKESQQCSPHLAVGDGRCGRVGLISSGLGLEENMGGGASYFWALGLLAAGQAATMVCTYAGQIIMNGCLRIEIQEPWKRVSLTRCVSLCPALALAVATSNDLQLFSTINEYLNVVQSVQLPFAMLPLLHVIGSKKIMTELFASGPVVIAVTTGLAVALLAINGVLVALVIIPSFNDPPVYALVMLTVLTLAYFGICTRLMAEEIANFGCMLSSCFGGQSKAPSEVRVQDKLDEPTQSSKNCPTSYDPQTQSVQP